MDRYNRIEIDRQLIYRIDKLWKTTDMYHDFDKVYAFEHNMIPTNQNNDINITDEKTRTTQHKKMI